MKLHGGTFILASGCNRLVSRTRKSYKDFVLLHIGRKSAALREGSSMRNAAWGSHVSCIFNRLVREIDKLLAKGSRQVHIELE